MDLRLRASQYILRYAPSRSRLLQYVTRKKSSHPDVLLEELGYDEKMMIDMWMRTYIAGKKGKREIQEKLRKKEFPPLLIAQALEEYVTDLEDFDEYHHEIQGLIEKYRSRKKSTQEIRFLLKRAYPYFVDDIERILLYSRDNEVLVWLVDHYRHRYDITNPHDTRKLYAALMRRGFRWDQIREVMRTIS